MAAEIVAVSCGAQLVPVKLPAYNKVKINCYRKQSESHGQFSQIQAAKQLSVLSQWHIISFKWERSKIRLSFQPGIARMAMFHYGIDLGYGTLSRSWIDNKL